MNNDRFPQDDAIDECRKVIEEMTAAHKAALEERQAAERKARRYLKEVENAKEALRIHQSGKLEEMERRAAKANASTSAIPAAIPASLAFLAAPPSPVKTKRGKKAKDDKISF